MDLTDNLVRQIGLVYRAMMRALDAETTPMRMGSGRFSYLFMLYISEGITQQEMAQRLRTDKAAVARTLAQLEVQGYIQRRNDPADGRVTRVYLTDKSRRMRADLEAAVQRVIDRLIGDRDSQTQAVVEQALSEMLEHLEPDAPNSHS